MLPKMHSLVVWQRLAPTSSQALEDTVAASRDEFVEVEEETGDK